MQVLKHICIKNQLISCVKEEKEEEEKNNIYIYILYTFQKHILLKNISS